MIPSEPRFVFIKKTQPDLGISLIGGNAVGIFVREVRQDSLAAGPKGLRAADQILEVCSLDSQYPSFLFKLRF